MVTIWRYEDGQPRISLAIRPNLTGYLLIPRREIRRGRVWSESDRMNALIVYRSKSFAQSIEDVISANHVDQAVMHQMGAQ
jgi:hypothetical protein